MPRRVNPGDIRVGPGHRAHDESAEASLTGPGMTGPGPNIGEADISTSSPPLGGGEALSSHTGSHSAHEASDIVTDGNPETLPAHNVEDALDQLAGTIPPEPPKLGYETTYLSFTGIPDWGVLKLSDSSLIARGKLSSENDPGEIFPYYWKAAGPALDSPEFDSPGDDPATDVTFNSGISPLTLDGAGQGDAFAGGFTRPGTGPGPDPVIPTLQLLERGLTARQVVLSGSLYPADRGVIALLHWPADGDVSDFLAQPLLERCVCAILLGQGILGEGPCVEGGCDGEPGLIFGLGTDADGEYDPFTFPGQATGQYNLNEIVTGVDDLYGNPLRPPWDDLDDDGNPGWQRNLNATEPGPGQVRLGTDPFADKGTGNAPVQPYGIPILGAKSAAYVPAPGGTLGQVVLDPANFFRYRLPYLNDYSQDTGLKYTPGGVPGTETTALEKARYFDPAVPASLPVGATHLAQAGDYSDFSADYYPWQVARYRQLFLLEDTAAPGAPQEDGSYILVHFKTEVDFEAYVRDGVLPDDATDGYEVYSSYLITGPSADIEDTGNRANEETSSTVPPPQGPAPAYGYSAESYHVIRATVFEDPDDHAVDPGEVSASCELDVDEPPDVMWVSGVAYFIPRNQVTGNSQLRLLDVDASIANFWDYSYRTDDYELSGDPPISPPALLSTPDPAFIGLAAFAFEAGTYTAPTGAAGASFAPISASLREQRIEIPFTHMNGGSSWSDAQGPPHGASAQISGSVYGPIEFTGDDTQPAFSIDTQTRIYLRRPFGHRDVSTAAQPYVAADGHGRLFVQTGGSKALYHSTSFDTLNLIGDFGNFAPATPGPAYANFFTADKDGHEYFLDEEYRWLAPPPGIDTVYGPGAQASLLGPGLQGWTGGPIETPIQMGIAASANWAPGSFIQTGRFLSPLSVQLLQVCGLPDRNPPLSDGNRYPFPSSGLLVYPQKDFSSGYRPTSLEAGAPQPNYSASTGTRTYLRSFDASLGGTVDAVGTPFVLLRIDGLQLQDFRYVAPGPGAIPITGIAIHLKVPGLTTWMDMGRADGSGPSKQDALLDGAGCLVRGPGTLDGVDYQTGMVFSQVKLNVGPLASLFASTGIDGSEVGTVPVLVRVTMTTAAKSFNLEEEYDPSTQTFSGTPETGVSASLVRGITGIRVVDPDAPFDAFGHPA